jgi:alpha-glucosidase
MWFNSGKTVEGRDGCRTPRPWTTGVGHGVTPGDPWLPFGQDAATRSVEAQRRDEGSMLAFYRTLIGLRRDLRAELGRDVTWLEAEPQVLAYTRPWGAGAFGCVLNTGSELETHVPRRAQVLLASVPGARVEQGVLTLPAESAVWLRVP